jgi:hypothetical protein
MLALFSDAEFFCDIWPLKSRLRQLAHTWRILLRGRVLVKAELERDPARVTSRSARSIQEDDGQQVAVN